MTARVEKRPTGPAPKNGRTPKSSRATPCAVARHPLVGVAGLVFVLVFVGARGVGRDVRALYEHAARLAERADGLERLAIRTTADVAALEVRVGRLEGAHDRAAAGVRGAAAYDPPHGLEGELEDADTVACVRCKPGRHGAAPRCRSCATTRPGA